SAGYRLDMLIVARFRYTSAICPATAGQENDRCIHARPLCPISLRGIDLMDRTAFARFSGEFSTHKPQRSASTPAHGAPLLTITGTACASDSATTIPKFSVKEGTTHASA